MYLIQEEKGSSTVVLGVRGDTLYNVSQLMYRGGGGGEHAVLLEIVQVPAVGG